MEVLAGIVVVGFWISVIIAWNLKDWIKTYHEGKAAVAKEERLAAEALARGEEAKLASKQLTHTKSA